MNSHKRDQSNHVADRNVERLLGDAYEPVSPDPAFVKKATVAMHKAAKKHAQREKGDQRRPRRVDATRLIAWTIAASALIALGIIFGTRMAGTPKERDLAEQNAATPAGQERRRFESPPLESPLPPAPTPFGRAGTTARPRAEAPPGELLAVGDTLATGPRQRRRVVMPDGSILYLNENTALTLDRSRHIALTCGEVFVEVCPSEVAGGRRAERFAVVTPDRRVTALGTKFNIRLSDAGTDVLVTQGRVAVSGLNSPLLAGQRLSALDDSIAPAPRATHVLDWTRDLIAMAHSPLVPKSKFAGGALVAVDPNGQESRLSLRKYHVDVYIEDGFARTTIDQTYFNHESRRLEGTFYFPLPPDASLSRLAMYVGERLMEGGMAERGHARQVFETIVHKQKDPALLEWVDGSTFKMRVFPLEGRQEKRIIISYTQKLPAMYDRTSYRFPAGHSMSNVGKWSARMRVKNGAGLRWESSSHDFTKSKQKGDLVLECQAENIKPDRDIVLTLGKKGSGPFSDLARFSTTTHEGSKYLMLRWRPELPGKKHRERRDWVFLFESSADRNPLLARAQIDIIRTLLENVEHDDTFSVVTAGTAVDTFAAKPQAATPKNVRRAVEFLEGTHLLGALDLGRAFHVARSVCDSVENPYLVHVGSGVPVLGKRDTDDLLKRLPSRAVYVGVGVGKRWGRNLMKTAASRSGGFFTQINPDEEIIWRSLDLLATLNGPRLLNIRVNDDAERLTFLCHQDSLAAGEELCAIARIDGKRKLPKSVEITGTLSSKQLVEKIRVRDVTEDAGYLPRTWAKLEIDRLVADGAEKNRARIVELSKAMYVMSPFTSLLVLENEAMYAQYKIDRGRKDHWALYPCPAKIKVVHEPLHSKPAVAKSKGPEKPEPTGPTPEEILGTILARIPPPLLHRPGRKPFGQTIVVPVLLIPDRGTAFIGGIRRFSEGRNITFQFEGGQTTTTNTTREGLIPEFSVPILNKIPYTNRLFGATAYDPLDFQDPHIAGPGLSAPVVTLFNGQRAYVSGTRSNDIDPGAFHLYVGNGAGADGTPGKVYKVDENGRLLGWVNLPVAPTGFSLHRDTGLVLALPRGGGRIVRIDEAGTASRVEELRRLISHPDSASPEDIEAKFKEDMAHYAGDFSGTSGQYRQVVEQMMQTMVQNDVNKARGQMGNDPERATQNLKLTLEMVRQTPDLTPEVRDQLVDVTQAALRASSRRQVELEQDRQQRGENVARAKERMLVNENLLRKQQKVRQLMERFNTLMDEGRYRLTEEGAAAEAAAEVPENPVPVLATLHARQTGKYDEAMALRIARQKGVVDILYQVEKSHVPVPDEPPIIYPESGIWQELSARRKERYSSMDTASRGTAEKKIDDALRSPTQLEFVETPLSDVVDYLRDYHDIEIQVDKKALDDVGVGTDTPITKDLKGISLRSALRLTLRELDLTYVIQDEVLLITTPEEAETRLTTRVYPVNDLVLGGMGGFGPSATGLFGGIGSGYGGGGMGMFDMPAQRGEFGGWGFLNSWMDGGGYYTAPGFRHTFAPPPTRRPFGVLPDAPKPDTRDRQRSRQEAELQAELSKLLAAAQWIPYLGSGRGVTPLAYKPPVFSNDWGIYYDLLRYAPGMNATTADVWTVLEAEASSKPRETGKIDPKARSLIETARGAGWRTATIKPRPVVAPDGKKTKDVAKPQAALVIDFDGTGRYRYERTLPSGLREVVLCDGSQLCHLYPELGIGARRTMSRFHRRRLPQLIPWSLPPAEDFARSADLVTVGKRTVAIVPLGIDKIKDKDGKPIKYIRTHLVFADDGRLAERQLVAISSEKPSKKVLVRQAFAADGTVRWFAGDGKKVLEYKIELSPCGAPQLKPDAKQYVLLPLPGRTRASLRKQGKVPADHEYENWSEETALAAIASGLTRNPVDARRIIARRFLARGDRRLGFYTLLLSDGWQWNPSEKTFLGAKQGLVLDPLKDHPKQPLANYIAAYLKVRKEQKDKFGKVGPKDSLFGRLAGFYDLYTEERDCRASEDLVKDLREALPFIHKGGMSLLGWALLNKLHTEKGTNEFHRDVAELFAEYERYPAVAYAARYERAKALQKAGETEEARKLLTKLFRGSIRYGVLPPIDEDFRKILASDKDASELQPLMQEVSKELIDDGVRPPVVLLGWRLQQLGDEKLADEMVGSALDDTSAAEDFATTMLAFEYFWATGKMGRAAELLEPLLEDKVYARWTALWRLAAKAAEQRGMTDQAFRYREHVLTLEYENLPEKYNVESVRGKYREMFAHYAEVAAKMASARKELPAEFLTQELPKEFLARVIRTADQWRALDTDPTEACQAAADVFEDLGAADLAWQYLTTPLAARPNEAAPWVSMAKRLQQQSQFDLADRAYASAFEAESTNAGILWDRAQSLIKAGRRDEAKRIFRQIADGDWGPDFRHIQSQAKSQLAP